MSDVREAARFVDAYRDSYLKLLRKVRDVGEAKQVELGPGVIDGIYSRRESMGGGSDLHEFKEAAKIAGKVRQKGLPVGVPAFLELNDVIGRSWFNIPISSTPS